ncbi:MAG TPA: TerC family protein [Thermomicrobiaceae bacterium]|nr:TerC family protein [Thermomicrobiaceae bacterium]
MDWEIVSRVLSIVLLDLVLSGDNAVVIGMATRRLPGEQRRRAIIFGGAGAVVLRIIFTAAAALLLGVPLLMAFGGLLLLWIAFRLVRGEDESEKHASGAEASGMMAAIRTIVLADVVMSLDNMLAVGGAAHGSLLLLLFGLALSVPILLLGSGLVARLMNRLPWLVWLGAAILVWTAIGMILDDPLVEQYVLSLV